jgi:mannosyltransferase
LNVCIDGIVFSLQATGGVSVYVQELLGHLRGRPDVDVQLKLFEPLRSHDACALRAWPGAQVRRAAALERYRRCAVGPACDVFHSSYYRRPANDATATVVTVHDFYYERFRRGPARWVHSGQKLRAIRAAQAIICVSQATADDLIEFVGVRADQTLHVIHNGVGRGFTPDAAAPVDSQQLLFVGRRDPYKNFHLVLDALALLPAHRLVAVGGGALRPEEAAALPRGVRDRIECRSHVSPAELAALYRSSSCLLYPSRFEGFGIPVAEAMRCACPVIGLDSCAAVKEIAGDAMLGLADADPQALAEAVLKLQDAGVRAGLVLRGLRRGARFDWGATHERTLGVYQELATRCVRA